MAMIKFFVFMLFVSVTVKARFVRNVCKCGVMASTDQNATAEVEHSLFVNSCNEEGAQDCKKICLAMARASLSSQAMLNHFCKLLKKDLNLVPSLFTKVCDKPYAYSGLTVPQVCCRKGRAVTCLPLKQKS